MAFTVFGLYSRNLIPVKVGGSGPVGLKKICHFSSPISNMNLAVVAENARPPTP